VDFSQVKSERRRSERVSESIPLIVRGLDLLGQPFEERTFTLYLNLHGCIYSSKHHLPKNSWVTLGLREGSEFRNVRARIAWLQRPQSVREAFEVAVELESPGNVWGIQFPPENWAAGATPAFSYQASISEEARAGGQSEAKRIPVIIGTTEANVIGDLISENSGLPENSAFPSEQHSPVSDPSPLLRDLTAELQRQANQAMESAAVQAAEGIRRTAEESEQRNLSTAEEFFQRWKENLHQAQEDARTGFSAHLSAKQEEFLTELRSQFERRFSEAGQVLDELDQKTRIAREAEIELAGRVERSASPQQALGGAGEQSNNFASAAERWNERLTLELGVAQSQWNELLQSSLDSGVERLALQLSERSQDVLRNAEQRLANRFAELRQPLAEASAEARDGLNRLRSELEREMAQARESLAEIEHVAARLKDYSGQLEASSHDTLNELHRRLENILEGHTREMNRHAESLVAGMWDRLNPSFEALGNQLVERATAEAESRLAPYLDRVPGLIRDLSAREMQAEDSLRLHRERLRQLSDNNQREAAARATDALSGLRNDFETARKEAAGKWNEEISAIGARASQAVSESLGQSAEWLQDDARARLQVVVEQVLATARTHCESINSESAQKFADEAGNRAAAHLREIQQQLENAGSDVSSRTRSSLDEAASAAAASFGHLLQTIAGTEAEHFVDTSRNLLQERTQDLERSAQDVLGKLTASGEASLEGFRHQLAFQTETSVAEGRNALAAELSAMLERFGSERAAREQEWAQGLSRLSEEATEKHQDRLQNACDAWLVSSVRRLNEHGQNVVESLLRSTDQALRDSCARVFEGLAETIRGRSGGSSGFPGFAQSSAREVSENPAQ
jgi:hypothetical protein